MTETEQLKQRIAELSSDLNAAIAKNLKFEMALREVREYFDQRSDADYKERLLTPNEEMKMLVEIDHALSGYSLPLPAQDPGIGRLRLDASALESGSIPAEAPKVTLDLEMIVRNKIVPALTRIKHLNDISDAAEEAEYALEWIAKAAAHGEKA